jgi:hypothetical protein
MSECALKMLTRYYAYFVGKFAEAGFPLGAHLRLAQNLKSFGRIQVLLLRAWHERLARGLQIVRPLSLLVLF